MKYLENWAYNVGFNVKISTFAAKKISEISDVKTLAKIKEVIVGLSNNPEKQGKLLSGNAAGYRRARYSRYRIIYKVILTQQLVVIAYVGVEKEGDRKDVYREFDELLDSTDTRWYLDNKYF